MSTFGFVPFAAPAAPLIAPGLQAAFASVAALFGGAATWTAIQYRNHITDNYTGQQTSIGLPDNSFTPWGPDPYEPAPIPDGGQQTVGRIPDTLLYPAPTPLLDSQWQIPQPPEQVDPQAPVDPEFVNYPVPTVPSVPATASGIGGVIMPANVWGRYLEDVLIFGFNDKEVSVRDINPDRIVWGVDTEWVNNSIPRYVGVVRAYNQNVLQFEHKFKDRVYQVPATTDFRLRINTTATWGEFDWTLADGIAEGWVQPYTVPWVQPQPPPIRFPDPLPQPQPDPEIVTPRRKTEEIPDLQPTPEEDRMPIPGVTPLPGQMPEINIGELLQNLLPPNWQQPPQLSPDRAISFDPNGPNPVPQVDPQGLPLKIRELINTATDIHQITNGLSVNSGKVRRSIGAIATEVGRIEQKQASMARGFDWGKIGDLIDGINDLQELIEALPGVNEWPAHTWSLQGICEQVEEGEEQPIYLQTLAKAKGEEAIINRLDALPGMLQAHLGFKTPTCSKRGKAQLAGNWVTAQWISDETSSDSPLRLRKRTRYRSLSGRSDSELADWFGSFVWEAGPVCVIHKGTWWGTPQVWARDADEGKRVIRHLAREAGINPDKDGQWEVSGSRNPRFGRRGTMRLRTIEGFPWVSSRTGSNMLPMG